MLKPSSARVCVCVCACMALSGNKAPTLHKWLEGLKVQTWLPNKAGFGHGRDNTHFRIGLALAILKVVCSDLGFSTIGFGIRALFSIRKKGLPVKGQQFVPSELPKVGRHSSMGSMETADTDQLDMPGAPQHRVNLFVGARKKKSV